jgi:diaminopimelate epimerase
MRKLVTFTKIEALQNDFLIVRSGAAARIWSASRVRAICDRRRGVGADGLITLGVKSRSGYLFRLFNADGSQAEWSGNGVRCAAAWLAEQSPREHEFLLRTQAGPIPITLSRSGKSRLDAAFTVPSPIVKGQKSSLPGFRKVGRPWVVDAGNPHWVFRVRDFDFDWQRLGQLCQQRAQATHGVNVEFVRVISPTRIDMRLYERGVGPTPSSGTGALAAYTVCRALGRVGDRVRAVSEGGVQEVRRSDKENTIQLAARVHTVFNGVWDLG